MSTRLSEAAISETSPKSACISGLAATMFGRQLLAGVEFQRRALRKAGGLADRGEQFVQVNRLGKIIDSAVAHGADGVADVGIGRDEQDGKGAVLLAGQAQRFQAGQPGHAHVGNHHVDLLLAQDFQGALAGGDGHGLEPLAGQERIEQAALAGVVIHDQEPGRAGVGGCRSGGTVSILVLKLDVGNAEKSAGGIVGHALDFPAVGQDDLLDDGQAKAGAFRMGGEVGFENLGAVFRLARPGRCRKFR